MIPTSIVTDAAYVFGVMALILGWMLVVGGVIYALALVRRHFGVEEHDTDTEDYNP